MGFETEQALAVMEMPEKREKKDRTAKVKVFVFRHGSREQINGRGYTCWSPDSLLTQKGAEQMKGIVERCPELKRCEIFASSPLPRAVQSLCVMMLKLGHRAQRLDEIVYDNGLKPAFPEAWYSENPNATVAEQWRLNSELVEMDGEQAFEAVQSIAMKLLCHSKKSALCVSHGGIIDAMVAHARKHDMSLALFDKEAFANIKDLGTGEGVEFTFDCDDGLVEIKELRLPA